MKTYTINKTFKNQQECDQWEETNVPDRKYNGECVLMIGHTEDIATGTVTIDSIVTC